MKKFFLSKVLWGSIVGALALYSLVGFVVVPWVAERILVSMTAERVGATTTVENIRLNPFSLTVEVTGVDVIDADDKRLMSLGRLFLNLQANSLWQRVINLREVALEELHLSYRRYDETDSNITRALERWNATAPKEPEPAMEESSGELPRLLITDFRVVDASFAVTDDVPEIPVFTTVDSLDLSLQNLSTLPDGNADQSLTLVMGNGSQIRWQGSLSLAPIRSEGSLELLGPYPELAYSYLREQLPVRIERGWFSSGFDYEMSMSEQGGVEVAVRGLDASLSDLELRTPAGERVALLPLIGVENAELHWPASTVSVQGVVLDAFELHVARLEDGSIDVLNLLSPAPVDTAPVQQAPAAAAEPAIPWQVAVAQATISNWVLHARDLQPAEDVTLDIGINLSMNNLSNQPEAAFDMSTDLVLSSGGQISSDGSLTVLPGFAYSGQVGIEAVSLQALQPYVAQYANVTLDSGVVSVVGNVSTNAEETGFDGSVSLDTLAISDAIAQEALFGIGSLRIEEASVRAAAETAVNIGSILIEEPYARVEIEADSTTNLSRTIVVQEDPGAAEAAVEEQDAEPAAETAAALPAILVDRIQVNNGSADFADWSLPLPFSVHMQALGGEISTISTNSAVPARLSLEGQVDDYGLASISGQLRPLDFASLTEVDMSFRNLDIPSMSPYVIKFAGRRIDDGAMDVDLAYRISESQLDGDNSLVLRDLELGERVDHPEAMDLPLGLAIALLKDRNGVIDLAVPVTGDLGNPQFSYGSVIRTALANIITNIVTSPFRFLSNLVGGGEGEDLGLIDFRPGRSDLAPPEREKLARLASALAERPGLLLTVAGVYDETADTEALQEQFLDRRIEQRMNPAADTSLTIDDGQGGRDTADAAAPSGSAAAAGAAEPGAAVPRTEVLESLYREAHPGDDDAAQLYLAVLRLQHTQEEQFDELAYADALRTALLPLEPVSEQDLQALASARAAAIRDHLGSVDGALAARITTAEPVAAELEDGWIGLELELEVN